MAAQNPRIMVTLPQSLIDRLSEWGADGHLTQSQVIIRLVKDEEKRRAEAAELEEHARQLRETEIAKARRLELPRKVEQDLMAIRDTLAALERRHENVVNDLQEIHDVERKAWAMWEKVRQHAPVEAAKSDLDIGPPNPVDRSRPKVRMSSDVAHMAAKGYLPARDTIVTEEELDAIFKD